jgi:hypothetical protein
VTAIHSFSEVPPCRRSHGATFFGKDAIRIINFTVPSLGIFTHFTYPGLVAIPPHIAHANLSIRQIIDRRLLASHLRTHKPPNRSFLARTSRAHWYAATWTVGIHAGHASEHRGPCRRVEGGKENKLCLRKAWDLLLSPTVSRNAWDVFSTSFPTNMG